MDFQFPQQLFPSFYNGGPPDSVLKHSAGSWGSYHAVRVQGDSGPLSSWTCSSKHEVRGEAWRPTEPSPIPLLSPKHNFVWPVTPPDPLDFTEHLQNFFMDHNHDAFGCMSEILGENFNFNVGKIQPRRKGSVSMWKLRNFLDLLQHEVCQLTYCSRTMNRYSQLLWDVVPSVPAELLGPLLHRELTEQRDRMLFCEEATGGALAFIPSSQSGHGCLLYPANRGRDLLKFHKVALQPHGGARSTVDASSSEPYSVQLKHPVRQLSVASLFNQSCVGVRSDYHCGLWRVAEEDEPRLLQVVKTSEVATCISVSPHVLGEVLVASESGAADLWTAGKGMQKVRTERSNLYFNAKSSWRWCEFSAHPRVMLYADRTGAELTDMRVCPASGHTLFRISSTAECRSGERLILARYLGDAHSFHHLITTQYSAYILDERFPTLPVLKWDHMMESPPVFCHIVPAEGRSTKILLGSHKSQEVTLLQYSGGRSQACCSLGPPQSLLRARDSVKHLPVQIPRRLEAATNRLSAPSSGVTCIQVAGGRVEECLAVLQLTEAGDIFYQVLELQGSDSPPRPAAEGRQAARERQQQPLPAASQPTVIHTSSDEDLVAPTQAPNLQTFVAETPEREQPAQPEDDSSFSEGSDGEERRRTLRRLSLPVLINVDPDEDLQSDAGNAAEDKDTEERVHQEEDVCDPSSSRSAAPSQRPVPVKLSDGARATWKLWLQKVAQKSRKKKSSSRFFSVPTEGLVSLSDARETSESERLQRRTEDLRSCMRRRSLLVNSTLSASLTPPHEVVPLPDQVDTAAWTDPLSQRLTLSWQGEEAWRAWWEEETGVNTEAKQQALKRKRRRQKEARRAAGLQVELSSSFSSSSCPSEPDDDFFGCSGRSSASSQLAWSDMEVTGTVSGLSDILAFEAAEEPPPSLTQVDAVASEPAANTPRENREPPTPSRTRTLLLSLTQTPASAATRPTWRRRPADDLPDTAEDQRLKDGITPQRPPPPRSSFQSRPGTSQSSQPKKKKSRMGF